MYVSVENGLPGGRSVVQADVEAVDLVVGVEPLPDPRDQCPDVLLLLWSKVKEAAHVAPGHDQRVARAHGEPIVKGGGRPVGHHFRTCLQALAERALLRFSQNWASFSSGASHPGPPPSIPLIERRTCWRKADRSMLVEPVASIKVSRRGW